MRERTYAALSALSVRDALLRLTMELRTAGVSVGAAPTETPARLPRDARR